MNNDQPQSTASLWGDVFGLGAFIRQVNEMAADPNMQANVMAVFQSMFQGAQAMVRIEAKLDFLLRELGHDPGTAEYAKQPPALLTHNGAIGPGGYPAPGVVIDHGGSGSPPSLGPFGVGIRGNVGADQAAPHGIVKNA